MNYLVNGFSPKMQRHGEMKIIPDVLTESEFVDIVNHGKFESAIGHQPLSEYLSRITGKHILTNRKSIQAGYDDLILQVSVKGRFKNGKNVRYRNNLEFRLLRFEKQTLADKKKTRKIINEKIIGEV